MSSIITKQQIASIWLPAALLVVYMVAFYFLRDILPSTQEIVDGFGRLYVKYGYELIFFGAFLEAALLISFLVPGSSVVLAGAYFASQGYLSYPVFLIVAAAGFFLGYTLDYLIGYYGWYDLLKRFGFSKQINSIEEKLNTVGLRAFFIGYIHPNTASLFALSSGIIRMKFKKFAIYNLLAGTFWLITWTGLVYIFGNQIRYLLEDNSLLVLLFVPIVFLALKLARVI